MLIVFKLSSRAVDKSGWYIHSNYFNKAPNRELLDLYLKITFKKVLLIKRFERKMKSKTKLNSEHLFELAIPEITAI